MKRNFWVVLMAMVFCFFFNAGHAFGYGVVAMTFDDGYEETLTVAQPIMDNLPGTLFPTIVDVGNGGFLNWGQIWQLYDWYGWQVGNHTVNHVDLTTIKKKKTIPYEVWDATGVLDSKGFIDAGRVLALPYGAYNSTVMSILMKYDAVSIVRHAWAEGDGVNYPANFNRFAVEAISVEITTTLDYLKDRFDAAMAAGGMIVLVVHRVTWTPFEQYDIDANVLLGFCEYIREKIASGEGNAVTLTKGVNYLLRQQAGY